MANNNKVTIDADYFAELYRKAKEWALLVDATRPLVKERDELKAALDTANATNSAQAEQLRDALNEIEAMKAKLADVNKLYSADHEHMDAAERCIEDCWCQLTVGTTTSIIEEIIRAYREKKEAK